MMTDGEYTQTQLQLAALTVIVRDLPLEAFLARINRAETLAPILDPTFYMKAADALAHVRADAEAALAFKRDLLKRPARAGLL